MDFDFPVEVDSIDTIPEAARALYQEKDGKFTLPDSLKKKLDTSALSQAYQREKTEAKKLKDQVKLFESLGKTPEEIQELVKLAEEKNQTELEKKGEWEKMKQQMLDTHTKELGSLKDEKTKLQGSLEKYLIEAEATRQIAEQKGNATVLLPHIKAQTRVVPDDEGELTVRVVDAKGTPRVDGQGNYLTIKDLVTEMKASETFGCVFTGTGASGSGSNSGNQGGPGVGGASNKSKMSEKEKSAYISLHGLAAFEALPR